MTFSHYLYDDILIVEPMGDLLGLESEGLMLLAIGAYLRCGIRSIIVNLAHIKYINSSGLGRLIKLYTETRALGGQIVLASPGMKANKLFAITKLDHIFLTSGSVHESKLLIRTL